MHASYTFYMQTYTYTCLICAHTQVLLFTLFLFNEQIIPSVAAVILNDLSIIKFCLMYLTASLLHFDSVWSVQSRTNTKGL